VFFKYKAKYDAYNNKEETQKRLSNRLIITTAFPQEFKAMEATLSHKKYDKEI